MLVDDPLANLTGKGQDSPVGRVGCPVWSLDVPSVFMWVNFGSLTVRGQASD